MHELQLMAQVVRKAEEVCHNHPDTRLSRIRLEISSHSHLASHTPEELHATFLLAAQGSPVNQAMLDFTILPARGICPSCGPVTGSLSDAFTCPQCLSTPVLWEDQPELVLKDLELVENVE